MCVGGISVLISYCGLILFCVCYECALCWDYKSGKPTPEKPSWNVASEIPLPWFATEHLEKQPEPFKGCPGTAETEETNHVTCSWMPLAFSGPCWYFSCQSGSCVSDPLDWNSFPSLHCGLDACTVGPTLLEFHCPVLHDAKALSFVRVYLKCDFVIPVSYIGSFSVLP